MRDMPLPECLGTVVIHEYDAVTCTQDTCPRDMTLETWFGHHTSFVTCKTNDCPYCRFGAAMQRYGESNATSGAVRLGRLLEPEFRRRPSSSEAE
jgi:hypothetical protein